MPFWNKVLHHRREDFVVTGPIRLQAKGLSGDIHVRTHTENTVVVELHTAGDEQVLAGVKVIYTADQAVLDIDTKPMASGGIFVQRHDVDIEIVMPTGCDVQLSTASGDMTLEGAYGEVSLNSASGDIKVDECIMKRFEVSVASGDVHGSAGRSTSVNVVSGDVDLLVTQPSRVEVHSISGDIDIDIRRGLLTDVNASTLSGDIESNIDFTIGGENDVAVDVELRIQSLSGDIAIRRE